MKTTARYDICLRASNLLLAFLHPRAPGRGAQSRLVQSRPAMSCSSEQVAGFGGSTAGPPKNRQYARQIYRKDFSG